MSEFKEGQTIWWVKGRTIASGVIDATGMPTIDGKEGASVLSCGNYYGIRESDVFSDERKALRALVEMLEKKKAAIEVGINLDLARVKEIEERLGELQPREERINPLKALSDEFCKLYPCGRHLIYDSANEIKFCSRCNRVWERFK